MESIYHLNINGTMVGFDSTDTHSIEDAVIEYMGRNINIDIITLADSDISIYEQIKKLHQTNYKEKNAEFMTKLMKDDKYIMMKNSLIGVFSNGIFPSVITLLASQNNKIVLRTFGLDGPVIVEQLQSFFPLMRFISLESIWANDVNYFRNGDEIYPMSELNNLIESVDTNTHFLMKDNYDYWNKKGREASCGKCIYSAECPVFGFDDNNCMFSIGNGPVAIFKVNTIQCALDSIYLYDLVHKSGLFRKMAFVQY